jgi:cell division protein FtsI (penicillin-binding protein 3)
LDVKKDILWRVYLVFMAIAACCVMVVGRAVYIQTVQGAYWKALSDSLHLAYREMDADRGTIYSEDGSILSSSVPYFDVRIDFSADGLREKGGKRFRENLDSLAIRLSALFGDMSPDGYRRMLKEGYREKDRYFLLRKNIDFRQYREMGTFPLVRSGRNRSGFIFEEREKRLMPFGLLANRTIGLSRSHVDARGRVVSTNVGLELTYDSILRGVNGKRLVRRLSGGAFVPVEGSEIEPEDGKDLVTTLDINMQDIAQGALMRMMVANEALQGSCIVMEVATGKIKAIANLGRRPDGSYFEDMNYAIRGSEPGSTFKLATVLSLLEDGHATLDTEVDLESGEWKVASKVVRDSERHGRGRVTLKEAFELSSNVGMAKLVTAHYGRRPDDFIDHLSRLGLMGPTGLGLKGESAPVIHRPSDRLWSGTSLPWMGFGYGISLTPLHTLMMYNAIANGGRMVRPYLVSAILKDGRVLQSFPPDTMGGPVCSPATLESLRRCLEGVVENGTARKLKTPVYSFAGKTGTSKVANGVWKYADGVYQSSFAGYFPADRPRYSCIVVILNRPGAAHFYGADVAGPVFREVADRIHASDLSSQPLHVSASVRDSSVFQWCGWGPDFRYIASRLGMSAEDSSSDSRWASLTYAPERSIGRKLTVRKGVMPSVSGMGLRDALFLLENLDLKVVPIGSGKVRSQSIPPGLPVRKGQTVLLSMG